MRKIRVTLGLLAKVYLIDIGSIAVFTLQFLLFRFRNTDQNCVVLDLSQNGVCTDLHQCC
jgi:hypothetical protein